MCRCRIVACRHNREEAIGYQTRIWSTSPQICVCSPSKISCGHKLWGCWEICSWSWTLDSRERSSANSSYGTTKFGIPVSAPCTPSARLSTPFKQMEKSRGERGQPCFTQTLAAHLLACPHPAVCTHLCNTSLGGWRVDGEACDIGVIVPKVCLWVWNRRPAWSQWKQHAIVMCLLVVAGLQVS